MHDHAAAGGIGRSLGEQAENILRRQRRVGVHGIEERVENGLAVDASRGRTSRRSDVASSSGGNDV